MRLQYRVLIVLAALLVAAATFYPVPMRAGSADKPNSRGTIEQKPDTERFYQFDKAPVLVKHTPAEYPEKARKLGVETTVLLSVMVDGTGKVTEATVIPPDKAVKGKIPYGELEGGNVEKLDKAGVEEFRSLFEKSSIDAAMKWIFEPAAFKGKNVPAKVAVPVRFCLH